MKSLILHLFADTLGYHIIDILSFIIYLTTQINLSESISFAND